MDLKLKRIFVPEVGKVVYKEVGEFDLNALPPQKVVIKTVVSTISSGTERANLLGDRVGATEKGSGFPRTIGYTGAGEVVAVGSAVTKFKAGDRVVYFWGIHQTYQIVPERNVIKIEEGVSYQEAAFSFIASFSMAALRKVRLEIGEPTLVMGLGLLGQLAVQLSRAAGAAPLIAADLSKERRDEAIANGADYALNPLDKDFAEKVKELSDGGIKAAIEVTGVGAGLNETLDCMRAFGRVALLGCTRDSSFEVDYYRKVHSPGITLVGAHTRARPENDSSPGMFTHEDDIKAAIKMIKLGRLDFKRILKETHLPSEAPEVYNRLLNDRNFPIGVQFDWTKE